jgi:hypothetical protein
MKFETTPGTIKVSEVLGDIFIKQTTGQRDADVVLVRASELEAFIRKLRKYARRKSLYPKKKRSPSIYPRDAIDAG